MGNYNFDEIIDRRGTDCLKWDSNGSADIHPMWVADMDFAVAPQIREAMQKRLDHPVYGYTFHGEELLNSIVSWVGRRYHWDIQKEWITFSPGVVPALSMSILALTNPGDRVLIMTPVYRPFYNSIRENGRVIINSPLVLGEDGHYSIDFDLLESQIDSRCKILMMCNPHNPAGRVWTREELERLAEIVKRHDLLVISDEIHADFIFSGHQHISIASLAPDLPCVTFSGLSKSHMIAGYRIGWMVLSGNKRCMRDFIYGINMLSNMRLCSNVPAQSIVQTALGGHQSVTSYIVPGGRVYEQRNYVYEALNAIDGITAVKPKAAFYIFPKMDVKKFNITDDEQFALDLLHQKRILITRGGGFNWDKPDHFRIVYLPRMEVLREAMTDLADFFEHYRQH